MSGPSTRFLRFQGWGMEAEYFCAGNDLAFSLVPGFHWMCYFQQMLKLADSVKALEQKGAAELERLLKRIPHLQLKSFKTHTMDQAERFDLEVKLTLDGVQHMLIVEMKTSGQPRYAREAILQLKSSASHSQPPATPILIAPFLTPATRDLCTQEGISYVDLEGNARLAFGSVYIEITTPHTPPATRREYKSLFKGRSAKVLRVLLDSPDRVWKVQELSLASGVSIGHVSNVYRSLQDREWARREAHGFSLTAPKALLDAWSTAYHRPLAEERRFYTTLHGSLLEGALRDFFSAASASGSVALASFSAAHWIAPYGRTPTQYLYGDASIVELLTSALRLSSPAKGENVVLWIPNTQDVFFNSSSTNLHGMRCTSALQTYLDLMQGGERGREAGDNLRRSALSWTL